MNAFLLCLCLLAAVPSTAFFGGRNVMTSLTSKTNVRMAGQVAEKTQTQVAVKSPDFYWQFRLDRLVKKKGSELAFNAKNYEATDLKDLYYAYYLDLTLNGKIGQDFDKDAERSLSDSEWLTLYEKIADWTVEVDSKSSDPTNVPESDLDLVAQVYPTVNMRDLKTTFDVNEVGANFPYKNMKELLESIAKGTYKSVPIPFNEVEDAMKQLEALKSRSMKTIDDIFADADAFARNPFPDEKAKTHYKSIREKLSKMPQSPQQWNEYSANMEKQVDEMARLASKKVEHHHHGHDDDHHELSPAEEFKKKYGMDLSEMSERSAKYMSDPAGFMDNLIKQKYGSKGLDLWKKTEELSGKLSVMSAAEKAKIQAEYNAFINQA